MKWSFSLALLFLFAPFAFSQTAIVISEQANLRGTPTERGRVIDTVSQNDQVEIVKQAGAWFLVQTPDLVGWLHGNTIRLTSARNSSQGFYSTPAPVKSVAQPAYTTPRTRTNADSRQYYRGPRGGCYYINGSGKKTYVDHSYCN